jgi:protein phosphatase
VGNREYVQVDTRCVPLARGSRLLLCSDGLHGYLREQDIAPIVEQGGSAAVQHFVDLANERGGKDNITVVLVELD